MFCPTRALIFCIATNTITPPPLAARLQLPTQPKHAVFIHLTFPPLYTLLNGCHGNAESAKCFLGPFWRPDKTSTSARVAPELTHLNQLFAHHFRIIPLCICRVVTGEGETVNMHVKSTHIHEFVKWLALWRHFNLRVFWSRASEKSVSISVKSDNGNVSRNAECYCRFTLLSLSGWIQHRK